MINKITKLFVFLAVCIELSLCLTYRMFPNENACFYGIISKPGEKVGFYFAVSIIKYIKSYINNGIRKFKFLLKFSYSITK